MPNAVDKVTLFTRHAFASLVSAFVFLSVFLFLVAPANAEDNSQPKPYDTFLQLVESRDPDEISQALELIEENWQPYYLAAALEVLVNARNWEVYDAMYELLEEKSGQNFNDISTAYRWLWNQPENISSGYADFKAHIYRALDPWFEGYFKGRQDSALIRLDEIRWGGVQQDGIPPLRQPKMINADQADYLADSNIVFGIEINGDARAYPKRILAWHEMFVDKIGGVDIAGVYCTLCGTVIPYKTKVGDTNYQLGTSGFLYRSNKLMYDRATQSLWNTIKGEPVVGPLAGKGIALEHLSIVTTTWGEWKRRHPDTQVLSLDTGHYRDYGEGVAYQQYFATDQLMFNTPYNDKRLDNKREVLALRFPASPKEQLAIDTEFLNKHPLYTNSIGRQKLLILTDKSGANRVFDPQQIEFESYDQDSQVIDTQGIKWQLTEEWLVSEDGRRVYRLPYHRAFWFGWHATYPETRLIK